LDAVNKNIQMAILSNRSASWGILIQENMSNPINQKKPNHKKVIEKE